MGIDVVTIFPDYLGALDLSLIGEAAGRGPLDLHVHDLRDHAYDRHRTIDDAPLGGGAGMVMKPDVWGEALDEVLAVDTPGTSRQVLIVPTPAEEVFTQRTTEGLAGAERLVSACGRYGGVDACVSKHYVSRGIEVCELGIGSCMLNGGEVTTIVMIEATARLLPGVLGNPGSLVEGSHGVASLLEYPVHARSTRWRGLGVDPILLPGDHGRIAQARRDQALTHTVERRLNMIRALGPVGLDREDRALLARLGWAVPAGADHPVPVHLHSVTADGAHVLAKFAAYAFPDACGNVIDSEFLEHRITTSLVPGLFATWANDNRIDLILAKFLEPPPVRDDDPEGRASTDTAPALVSYAAILREGADSDGEQPYGIDPHPACVRPAEGEVVGELSKAYVDATMKGPGLAPTLIDAVTRQAGVHGTDLLWLDTHVTNKRAQRTYKRANFRQVGARTYDVGNQDAHDVVVAQRAGEDL